MDRNALSMVICTLAVTNLSITECTGLSIFYSICTLLLLYFVVIYCILFCITVAVTKLLDNIQQSKLNFATFVIMHEMNCTEKAFFVTSISFMIQNKNRSYSHISLQLGNPYINTEQNTVSNKVQNQKCAGLKIKKGQLVQKSVSFWLAQQWVNVKINGNFPTAYLQFCKYFF